MAPLGNNNATSTFTKRINELGHVLIWASAHKETESIQVHGRDRERTLWVITAECSGCDFTKTMKGKTDYASTRSTIKQAWRKAHSHLIPKDTPLDPPGTPDIGIGRSAYEQVQRDAAAS